MTNAKEVAYTHDSILEIANIESHITFLSSLLRKYSWENSIKNKIFQDLAFIEQKKNDRVLHLSVVGEFSCGKSTFINALLRDNLLEADIIQGTTVAATTIRYASEYAVIVIYKNGEKEIFDRRNIPDVTPARIREYVKELTTNEKLSAKIKEVIIEHPASALQGGISIIDTPGTNSVERWHEDVTKTAIRDISDVSIVLTSAEQPLPDTLNEFVKQNLGDVLQHCVFVVTKMDLVREKERERQLDYIRQKVSSTFDIENPLVLPYTPKFVLGEADDKVKQDIQYSKPDYPALIQQSYQTESQIYQTLSEQRFVIQVQKMLSVMDDMLSYISADMKRMSDGFQKSQAALQKAAKRDLREFTGEMKNKCCGSFQQNMINIFQDIMNSVYGAVETEKKNIKAEFDDCRTSNNLIVFKNKLSELLNSSSSAVQEKTRIQYGKIRRESYEQMESFWKEFVLFYNELDALSVKKPPNLNANEVKTSPKLYSQTAIDTAIKKLDSYENKWAFGGGAAAGAAAGLIFGPVGAVVGGIGGFMIGLAQADKKFNEYKSKIWSSVSTVLDSYFGDVVFATECDINEYIRKIDIHMRDQIDDCLKTYKKFVDEKIRDDSEKKRQLELDISVLRQDASEVESRHEKIKFFGEKIRQL